MRIGTYFTAASALALGLAAWTPGYAQGPLWDTVHVNLPHSVTVGDHTLQPGEYTIQEMRDAGGAQRILTFYSTDGNKFETSAITIPALDQSTPQETKVVLHRSGPDYYVEKIWIQGKDYGYEFPVPASIRERERERMEALNATAAYSAQAATVAQAEQPAPQPAPTPEPQPTEQAPPPPQEQAQAAPPPEPAPAPAPETQPQQPPETPGNTANREMPATSAGWLGLLLSGGALSGLGMLLRRKRD
jgi:hypothetical protein